MKIDLIKLRDAGWDVEYYDSENTLTIEPINRDKAMQVKMQDLYDFLHERGGLDAGDLEREFIRFESRLQTLQLREALLDVQG